MHPCGAHGFRVIDNKTCRQTIGALCHWRNQRSKGAVPPARMGTKLSEGRTRDRDYNCNLVLEVQSEQDSHPLRGRWLLDLNRLCPLDRLEDLGADRCDWFSRQFAILSVSPSVSVQRVCTIAIPFVVQLSLFLQLKSIRLALIVIYALFIFISPSKVQ